MTGDLDGRRRLRALVYGDVNLNIIDGSAIWAQSMTEALSRAGLDVTVLLKARVQTARLVDPIAALPGVTVVRPFEDGLFNGGHGEDALTPTDAEHVLKRLDAERRFDLIVVRGLRLVSTIVGGGHFDGRLWTYLTDLPQSATLMTDDVREQLGRVALASRCMLCQTEELRTLLESSVPEACGNSLLWPPIVPDPQFPLPTREPLGERPIRLGYSGKFAPRWNTFEMASLPTLFAESGVAAELHMVGDKIHRDPADPGFASRMRRALEDSSGVVWHGGMARQEAMRLSASMDFGLSWRHPSMDASLELSTKVLEFGALGVPLILNRSDMHEQLLGLDYPLFVADEDEIIDAVTRAVADPSIYADALARCSEAAQRYSLDRGVERLSEYLDRIFPTAAAATLAFTGRARPLRVAVASHDLKFFNRILEHLRGEQELEVRVDQWSALAVHDEATSNQMLEWADVVVAEWCGPNAVWYSKRKRPGQRLIVRLHRFELDAPWLDDVDIHAVDQLVCVSPHYAQLTAERTGWPADRVVVVPNWVDVAQFDRPKLPGAAFHLGMIGIAPMRKRLDLGLDVLERLRRRDPRYLMFVKTKLPWEYWWIWKRAEERAHYDHVFHRLQTAQHLRGAVIFDGFGPDVAAWLRRIGWVLSTSDDESFHLAPAEGMAAGAVPAILPWPGADTIYAPTWIHQDVDAMAEAIDEAVRGDRWEQSRQLARDHVLQSFPLEKVCATWTRLLVENLSPYATVATLASSTAVGEAPR